MKSKASLGIIFAAVILCLLCCNLKAQVSFKLSSKPGAGNDPNSIAAADVNGDGKVDMICVNYYDYTVSVLTNNGSGRFVPACTNSVGTLPTIVIGADVNGDGAIDAICANSGGNTVSVLTNKNNGSGGLVPAGDYTVGSGPTSVASADVNGDGKADLITANWNSNAGNTLTVLTNNGSGRFALASSPIVGPGPVWVTAADVNGDGKVDLISANRVDSTLTVLTNKGDGGFMQSGTNSVGSGPNSITAADINVDGKVDLITAIWGESTGNTLTVLTNNGSGRFVFSSTVTVDGGPLFVAAADVNGDGALDLISANNIGKSLSVVTNNGFGRFVIATNFSVGNNANSVAAADVNGDGKVDLLVPTYPDNTISVFTNSTPSSCDPAPSGLVAWWKAEGNAGDIVGGNNGSQTGGVAYASGEVSQAFNFNGTNAYVEVPSSPKLKFTNAFTAEAWVNYNATGNSLLEIVAKGQDVEGAEDWHMEINGGKLHADVYGSGGWFGRNFTTTLVPGVWYHLAVTYDGSNLRGYVNGTFDGTMVWAGPLRTTDYALRIGAYAPVNGTTSKAFFPGKIDELSLYNRALSSNEIASIYYAGSYGKCVPFVPPFVITQPADQTVTVGQTATFSVAAGGTAPLYYQWNVNGTNIVNGTNATLTLNNVQTSQAGYYSVAIVNAFGSTNSASASLTVISSCVTAASGLVSWWQAEGNASDIAGPNSGTMMNGAGFASGEVGQAFNFNGTSYVSIPDSSSLDGFTNRITIEAWVKVNSFAGPGWDGIVTKGNSSWELRRYSNGSTAAFTTVGLSNQDLGGQKNINDGQWHHVAGVYDGINKYLYVDGKLDAWVPATGTIAQNNYPVYIGGNAETQGNLPGYFWNGLIDEASIYNRALSPNEIVSVYNAGSYGKCVPQVPPFVITQPTNQTVTVGETAFFSVTAGGTQPLSYQWSVNGTNIDGATNTSLTLNNVQLSQAGNYSVLVTNIWGPTNSATAVLTVNPPPPCDPAPSGIVAWWQAEGNASDIAGPNSGTMMNGAGFASGEVGQAFNFNGTSYVSIPDSSSLDGFTNRITIEAWVKVNSFAGPGWDGIVTKGNSSWELRRYSNGSTAAFTTVGLSNQDLGGQKNINDGQWHHVAGVYDGINKYLYVDGKLDAWVPATGTIAQNNYPVYIGGNAETQGNLPGYFWNGLIDEASIYNRALSSNEIAAIYLAGSTGKCPIPPVADATATTPVVISINGTNATVVLDGSKSYDLDGDPLQYTWLAGLNNVIGSGVVAVVTLPVGTNSITLSVSDGALSNSQTIAVTVLTISQAIDRLIAAVNHDAAKEQSLVALLRAALASIDKGNPSAVNQLQAFQNKVNVQLGPIDPVLAQSLYNDAQAIIDAIIGGGGGHVNLNVKADKANGKLHLNFAGSSGQTYIIEASSDMVHWQMIGVAKDQGNGAFQFDDAQSGQNTQRFYRVVVP